MYKHFRTTFFAITLVLLVGMFGLMLSEHLSAWQALFLTAETLTTVGFGDIQVQSRAGQVILLVLMLGGVAVSVYFVGRMMGFIIEGHLADVYGKRKREKKMSQLKDHIIICGAGRVGQQVAKYLTEDKTMVVIIEQREELVQEYLKQGFLVIPGDATQDEILKRAGIEHARGLITALPEDALNVFVTLTAKGLNPQIQVVARVDKLESEAKLYRAGADRVISPAILSGRRMALAIMKPMSIDYLDTVVHDHNIQIEIEEIQVEQGSQLNGLTLGESKIKQNTGATILAIIRGDQVLSNPSATEQISADDVLIVFGLREQVERLGNVATSR
ncbi:potassium channel family protein [Desulfitobacterium metallireducens]|uniref:Potassium transporter TrkA n=1 Tax=Desulfitobacterium metallireducens DSM 15288 TaxID=871968 RepID=W0ED66_9FIRM|nr:potassium channel protein [Desulfitobacterium metallireducens]AHF07026.1 potassium transporter TrkA [Desulfitobacterium metallireducens DSM 15288]